MIFSGGGGSMKAYNEKKGNVNEIGRKRKYEDMESKRVKFMLQG
jgi:hypothetical protein